MDYDDALLDPRRDAVGRSVLQFLREHMRPGDEAEVALHPELEAVVVFINGDAVLTCSFNDLVAGAGGSLN